MSFTCVVLTGGPGAGKTEAAQILQERLEDENVHVLVVPETATRLILSGIDHRKVIDNYDFQKAQLEMQLFTEDLFKKMAPEIRKEHVLMICDRGALDGQGFMDKADFDLILDELKLDRNTLLGRYDAIYHLETAAKSNLDLYTLKNNAARKETASQAIAEDDLLIETWKAHPDFHIIPAKENIEEKIDILEAELRTLLKSRISQGQQIESVLNSGI